MVASSHAEQLYGLCASAAREIHEECTSLLSAGLPNDDAAASPLVGCGPALINLLSRQALQVRNCYGSLHSTHVCSDRLSPDERALILKRLDDIASIAYAKFYAFLFKDLPVCWRQLYTDASIVKFCFTILHTPYVGEYLWVPGHRDSPDDLDSRKLSELIKILDLAIILAGPAGERRGRRWIDRSLELLHLAWVEDARGDGGIAFSDRAPKRTELPTNSDGQGLNTNKQHRTTFSTDEPFTPPVRHPIRTVEALPLEQFQAYMDRPRDQKLGPEPLVIRHAIDEWPSFNTRPWKDPTYLLSQTFGGRRLVPVEIGRSYVDEGWGQKLITFGELLESYIDPTLSGTKAEPQAAGQSQSPNPPSMAATPVAYLAQHPLFTQLPALRNDIVIPDYCYTLPPPHPTHPSTDQPELDEPLLNAWFGPPGTITPLHNDPYHNVLAQVVGRKYVRLYSPLETERMYARGKEGGVEMGNTSLIDVGVVEGWDVAPHNDDEASAQPVAAFKDAPFVDCILEPGDLLYIPIGWWHYVRGLSVSFSVSFWWN
ncbi:hypothetical protein DL766_000831 [Monosporascus sp. MC13-8B]|uniref:JmjC domain-containing protein n=1 Tax=Monosporascus cannonballus TaxID=155416 RepID=A0ABY0GTE0_9PEZI|nr:hypothetical protein DL762_009428 [Monosporascus cannonballus]RYO94133.1 hypothetical protein DL763_004201 [Monosporascus cannonballus]RYP38621.1 hypothetical protein DL766_000831 [Monosporascus sp. MC13-8B]